MANCNNLFQEFNKIIRLDNDRRINLRERRNNLRQRISNGFKQLNAKSYFQESLDVSIEEELEFQSQGSYVMDTIINPSRKEDEYDIDDGIYFLGKRQTYNRPTEQQFHDFVIASIDEGKGSYIIEKVEDKGTCVRVRYKGNNGEFNYHVDLPIYYATNVQTPELADTADGWKVSNPIEFIMWFEELMKSGFKEEYILKAESYEEEYSQWLNDRRKKDHQLRRIVRYLKAWGDHLKGDMPPGVVMTILAGSDSNFVENERDDVSLRNTLVNIQHWLRVNGFTCPRPTTPEGEDLFKGYSQTKKQYFENKLDAFIISADQALNNPNQKDACHKWQKHLGDRFPCELAKDEIEGAKEYLIPPVIKSNQSKSA